MNRDDTELAATVLLAATMATGLVVVLIKIWATL
jgi:hypothetical protein